MMLKWLNPLPPHMKPIRCLYARHRSTYICARLRQLSSLLCKTIPHESVWLIPRQSRDCAMHVLFNREPILLIAYEDDVWRWRTMMTYDDDVWWWRMMMTYDDYLRWWSTMMASDDDVTMVSYNVVYFGSSSFIHVIGPYSKSSWPSGSCWKSLLMLRHCYDSVCNEIINE